jgi:hypothetical protein
MYYSSDRITVYNNEITRPNIVNKSIVAWGVLQEGVTILTLMLFMMTSDIYSFNICQDI